MDPSSFVFTLLSGIATLLALYLTQAIVRMYMLRRREQLDEAYPFQNTLTLFYQREKILELCKYYFDNVYTQKGRKTFVLSVLGLPTFVMTNDVANITYVLKKNFENFGKTGGSFKSKAQGLLGNGIFNADGEQWYVHRKTSAHLFKLSQFKTSVLETFNQHLTSAVRLIKSKTGSAFDLQDVMHRLTLDSIGMIAFGTSLHCLERNDIAFAADFDYCTICLNDSFVNPFWRLERYCTPRGWRYFLVLRRINAFIAEMIQQRRQLIAGEGATRSGRVDLLSLYLDKDSFQDMDEAESESRAKLSGSGRGLYMEPSDANLRDVILNMVLAGRDTTAQALSWAFFEFCRHGEVQARCRQEVREVLCAQYREQHSIAASVSDADLLPLLADCAEVERLLSYAALQRMRYVEASCMETLRLYPSVPKEAKAVMADDTLPDGTKVYKGDILSFHSWTMGRDVDLWGANCLDFEPLRFLDQPKPSPFVFTAFQAGPRTCLGQNFAILEMKATIARLLLRFDFHLAQPVESVTYQTSLTLPIKGGLQVYAKEL
jgi:cytochrome P450